MSNSLTVTGSVVRSIAYAVLTAFIRLWNVFLYWTPRRRITSLRCLQIGLTDHNIKARSARSAASKKRLSRIIDAYQAAKEQQQYAPSAYAISPSWELQLDRDYRFLRLALQNRATEDTGLLLDNMHREPFAEGILGHDYRLLKSRWNLFRYEYLNTWSRYHDAWRTIADPEDSLTYPMVGNPVGVTHGGHVIPVEAIRYHYKAKKLLALQSGGGRPVICEIGGGSGGQAYALAMLAKGNVTYIGFDIPEVLAVCTYFLIESFPDANFRLFGENQRRSAGAGQPDFVLMPHFAIRDMDREPITAIYNANSLSEMTRAAAEEYVAQVERLSPQYFMHVNHDKVTQNFGDFLPASEAIPDSRRFRLIYKKNRIFGRDSERAIMILRRVGQYEFLYERVAD